MNGCYDVTCTHRRSEVVRVYTPYPYWLRLPDTIREHCECGRHNRTWSVRTFLEVWADSRKRRAA